MAAVDPALRDISGCLQCFMTANPYLPGHESLPVLSQDGVRDPIRGATAQVWPCPGCSSIAA